MEIDVSKESLKGIKLMVGTPMYGGNCAGQHMRSLLDLMHLTMTNGIDFKIAHVYNMSVIHEARNECVRQFLESDFTHFLFIDADMSFDASDILCMLALDKDIIGGSYPRKKMVWDNIKKAVLKNPSISNDELESIGGVFTFMPPDTQNEMFDVGELQEVNGIGTGLLLIKRDVFVKFRESFPEYELRDPSKKLNAFSYFNFGIISEGENRISIGEDYLFCYNCRKIGYKIWMAPFITCSHFGTYEFKGSMVKMAQNL